MAPRGLFAAAMVETAIVTWRDISQTKVPPPPSDFVAVAIIFGGLSLFPDSAGNLPSVFGWGFVLATFLNLWSPSTPTKLAVPGGTANVPSASQQKGGTKTTITPAVAGGTLA
jgi:hypothetical protein